MNVLKCLVAVSLVLAVAGPLWADVAPAPRQQNERVVANVSIKYGAIRGEAKNVAAKVVIPTYLVAGAGSRDVPAGKPAPTPKEETKPAPADRSSLPPWGTTIAGLALSLAAVSLVFVIRGKGRAKSAAVVALVSAGLLGGWGVAQADLIRPGARGEPVIVIELSDDADNVTLLLPK